MVSVGVGAGITAVYGDGFLIVITILIALAVMRLTCTDVSYITELPNFKHIMVLRSYDCNRETYEV